MGEPEQSVRCMLAAAHAARLHAQAAAPSAKEKVGGNDTFQRQCNEKLSKPFGLLRAQHHL